jgi:predicted RNase H-related nuclease YkuK (DUF458 family)
MMTWKRAGKKIEVPLNEYLEKLIQEELDLNHDLKVSVGTDSQRDGKRYKFATVIMITTQENLGSGVFVGRGGKLISATYHISTYSRDKAGVNERMLLEVGKSIEVAYEINPVLEKFGIKLEIHADINQDPKWESNKALSQAVGYILGMGYDFKVKPDAFAASYCGDHYAH